MRVSSRRSSPRSASIARSSSSRPISAPAGAGSFETVSGRGPSSSRILGEDRLLELTKRRRGLESKLVDERRAGTTVDLERIGLPARPVERDHQLPVEPLAEPVLGHERLELSHELAAAAKPEQRVDAILDRRNPELLQPTCLDDRPVLERQLRKRGPAP